MPLSAFTPVVRTWFETRLGTPTPPQVRGWPAIRGGRHTLIAAPTGTGKTLAAFLNALDQLFAQGADLPDEMQVLYLSPLKALGNDVQKNLQGPLAEIRAADPTLPEIRVLVRTGDTKQSVRAKMIRTPPHVLVTTPESLYILLTSDGGRRMLSTVRTVIVDEIHATLGSKRGSHLALSLERLEALTESTTGRPLQRIGLSATQKPVEDVASYLVGTGRDCALVNVGHHRELDLGMEIPPSELSTVCSHEVWGEIYERMVALIQQHRTTLVFVNTRKLAEQIAARLTEIVGEDQVTSHHGSLSRERRLEAERRLKEGSLRALVATASLELGIDIGDVDLVIQVGVPASIATFLQRVGRAGHAVDRTPKGRIFPLTQDELLAAGALLRAVVAEQLDRTPQPTAPLDILVQQIVAACVPETWDEAALYDRLRRAWPYRDLTREDFDAVVALHTEGRHALLHRDGVHDRLRATRRARLVAITSGGAIPDKADYRVVLDPEGTVVGSVDEDFAIESTRGDVFQLGNASWRVLRVSPGEVRVADAQGAPPSLPFWFGEAPSRTPELADAICAVREDAAAAPTAAVDGADDDATTVGGSDDGDGNLAARHGTGGTPAPDAVAPLFGPEHGVPSGAVEQIRAFVQDGERVLGAVPTKRRIILERFFDESGGMQLVLHAPFGSRINRAWGLALRKRFCVGFGFELQAAANEDSIVLSLGPQHSFPLEEVFEYLHPNTAQDVLEQALLAVPMFQTRWRWNVTRALLLPRMRGGKRVPAALVRMRADDLLVQAFPEVLACPETLAGPKIDIPRDHPLVRQTLEDCFTEAMDLEGFLDVLRQLRAGAIELLAVDTPEPSAFARSILNARPYAFLDGAPLEERRTQAVLSRRTLDQKTADDIGALDAEAVRRVREEAWPEPREAEEVHEALLWMGYVTDEEAEPWRAWIEELAADGRVVPEGDRWYAVEATRDPKRVLRGRMEALGPVFSDDPLLRDLETDGCVLRVRIDARQAWCDRRLLARIHRYTIDRLRREIAPVSPLQYLRFLACWQRVDEEHRVEGPLGVASVLTQLAGYEAPARAWEESILPARVRGYRREWLDQLTLSGQFVWGRFWASGASPIKTTPVAFAPREDLERWAALMEPPDADGLTAPAAEIREVLERCGAVFQTDLKRLTGLLPSHLEMGLAELVARGFTTCDGYGTLRLLIAPPSKRRAPVGAAGRWALFRHDAAAVPDLEFIARRLLDRTGVVFRKTLARERIPVPWRDLLRVYRHMELRGDVRGGRFVSGFDGEQYALLSAVRLLRKVRRDGDRPPVDVSAADPLNFRGILTPDARVSPAARTRVAVT